MNDCDIELVNTAEVNTLYKCSIRNDSIADDTTGCADSSETIASDRVVPRKLNRRILLEVAKACVEIAPFLIIIAYGSQKPPYSTQVCWAGLTKYNPVAVGALASLSLSASIELFMLITSVLQCNYLYKKGIFIACCTLALLLQVGCCIGWPFMAWWFCIEDLVSFWAVFLMKAVVAMVNIAHLSYLIPVYCGRRCRFCVGCMRYGLKEDHV
jgi:hypothetical protein